MPHTLTATEAARSLSDLLNRTRYRGETFVIVRGREEVARLIPPQAGAPAATLGDLLHKLRSLGEEHLLDDDFATDLAAIQASQPALPGDPWER
jgi:hypothetical protein